MATCLNCGTELNVSAAREEYNLILELDGELDYDKDGDGLCFNCFRCGKSLRCPDWLSTSYEDVNSGFDDLDDYRRMYHVLKTYRRTVEYQIDRGYVAGRHGRRRTAHRRAHRGATATG